MARSPPGEPNGRPVPRTSAPVTIFPMVLSWPGAVDSEDIMTNDRTEKARYSFPPPSFEPEDFRAGEKAIHGNALGRAVTATESVQVRLRDLPPGG